MAKVDITGLLTGLAGTPDLEREGIKRASAVQGTGLGSNLARSLALQAPQREQMMRQAAGGLFGIDTRTAGQQVQEQLGQLDVTTPEGQQQAVKLIAQIDPTRALALRTQFAKENKALQTASAAALVEEKRYQENLALEKRKVEATETSSLSSLLKAQTPSTSIVKGENGDYTVVEDKTGDVVSRGSTLSEAQKVAKELAPFQERQATKKVALNKIQEVETTMRRAEELMGISRYSQNSPEALENPKLIGEIMPSSLPGTGSDYWAKMVENVPALDVIGGFEITKLESEIKTLKSGLALDALAVLKKLSSTGASGLGATNAMEIEMLQNELVTLDATLPSDLPRKFDIIRKHMNTLLNISNDLPVEIEWSNPKYGKYTREFEGIRAYTLDNGKTFYNQVNNQLIPE